MVTTRTQPQAVALPVEVVQPVDLTILVGAHRVSTFTQVASGRNATIVLWVTLAMVPLLPLSVQLVHTQWVQQRVQAPAQLDTIVHLLRTALTPPALPACTRAVVVN